MRIAFIFPGQGSQYVGMGRALYETFDIAKKTYEEAGASLGWDVAKLCFEGPEETLNQTEYTQPAILTTSIAAWRALGVTPQTGCCVAGHSLGEYTALVVAEAIPFYDTVRLVQDRGRFMQSACRESPGRMAAIVGMDRTRVKAICESVATPSAFVAPANYNAPDQIVIAGHQSSVEKAMALAEQAGAKRVIQLAVSVPSHSPLMQPACQKLSDQLDKVLGRDLTVPLINNLGAKIITRWADARAGLVDQLAHPLLWEESVQAMRSQGADYFVEIGPGRVLSGLLKRMDRTLQVAAVENPEGIEKVRNMIYGEG